MMTNGRRNSKVVKHVLLGMVLSMVLLLSGCNLPWSKLNFRSFAQSMRGQHMVVIERDRVGNDYVIQPEWASQGITAWKVAGTQNGDSSLSFQYLEFDSETNAQKFFSSQASYFASAAGSGGSRKGNAFSAFGNGFYYYACCVDDKVVLGTCEAGDLGGFVKVINKMPKISDLSDDGSLK